MVIPFHLYKLPNLLDSNNSLKVDYSLDVVLAYEPLRLIKGALDTVAGIGYDVDNVCAHVATLFQSSWPYLVPYVVGFTCIYTKLKTM